ncbi:hypothetical protein BC828DRAFT_388184 [Blastocladiella britannica]|nr:hypothetical protein BC828DRAFT_388184 [Blastocladiella britannica]
MALVLLRHVRQRTAAPGPTAVLTALAATRRARHLSTAPSPQDHEALDALPLRLGDSSSTDNIGDQPQKNKDEGNEPSGLFARMVGWLAERAATRRLDGIFPWAQKDGGQAYLEGQFRDGVETALAPALEAMSFDAKRPDAFSEDDERTILFAPALGKMITSAHSRLSDLKPAPASVEIVVSDVRDVAISDWFFQFGPRSLILDPLQPNRHVSRGRRTALLMSTTPDDLPDSSTARSFGPVQVVVVHKNKDDSSPSFPFSADPNARDPMRHNVVVDVTATIDLSATVRDRSTGDVVAQVHDRDRVVSVRWETWPLLEMGVDAYNERHKFMWRVSDVDGAVERAAENVVAGATEGNSKAKRAKRIKKNDD